MQALKEIGFKKALKYFFWTLWEIVFKISVFPPLRAFLMRVSGARIGKGTIIMGVKFSNLHYKGFKNLIIGDYVYLGEEVFLDLAGKIMIEDYAVLAGRAMIITHLHLGFSKHPLREKFPDMEKEVILKRGCFVGAGALILPGVEVGEEAVVGAGAVVCKKVSEQTVVVGNPAKEIRKI